MHWSNINFLFKNLEKKSYSLCETRIKWNCGRFFFYCFFFQLASLLFYLFIFTFIMRFRLLNTMALFRLLHLVTFSEWKSLFDPFLLFWLFLVLFTVLPTELQNLLRRRPSVDITISSTISSHQNRISTFNYQKSDNLSNQEKVCIDLY